MTYYIIPCGGAKLDKPAKARDLYVGQMFCNTLGAALAQVEEGDEVLILSAKHGLLRLDDVVEPYEQQIDKAGAISVETLSAQAEAMGFDFDAGVYAFLPKAYFRLLDEALRTFDCYPHQVYEASDGGIGEQRRVNRLVQRVPAPDTAHTI